MELPLTGGCQCGKIRYEITKAPQLIYTCHCTDCQRITGSAFSLGIALPETAFHRIAGEPWALDRAVLGQGHVIDRAPGSHSAIGSRPQRP